MKLTPYEKERKLLLEMTEPEWDRFKKMFNGETKVSDKPLNDLSRNIVDPSTKNLEEKDAAGNMVKGPEVPKPKEKIESNTSLSHAAGAAGKNRRSRVENLFPGFHRKEDRKIYSAKGLIYVKCEHCKKEQVLFSKNNITEYKCHTCGHTTVFTEPFKKINYECECGQKTYVYSNFEDRNGINCKRCKFIMKEVKRKNDD